LRNLTRLWVMTGMMGLMLLGPPGVPVYGTPGPVGGLRLPPVEKAAMNSHEEPESRGDEKEALMMAELAKSKPAHRLKKAAKPG